jgi:hypothetical protein
MLGREGQSPRLSLCVYGCTHGENPKGDDNGGNKRGYEVMPNHEIPDHAAREIDRNADNGDDGNGGSADQGVQAQIRRQPTITPAMVKLTMWS